MLPQFTGGHIFIAWRHFRTPHGPLAPHSLNFKIFHRRLHEVKSNHPTSYMDICTSEYTTRATQEIWPHSSNTFFLPSSFPPFSYCLATRQRASITAKKAGTNSALHSLPRGQKSRTPAEGDDSKDEIKSSPFQMVLKAPRNG